MATSEKTTLRRQKWKRSILEIIRSTPNASRIAVKRQSGLSMDSTLSLVEELLCEGLILTSGKSDSGKAGRKATILEINPAGCYFIGVRFSAAGISGVLMDFSLRAAASSRKEFSALPHEEELVSAILSCIDELINALGANHNRLRGIGLGAPGIIDLSSGCILRYAHMPSISSLPLRRIVEEKYRVPVYLEHGVKCSARAALSLPEYATNRDMLFMQTGRGIHMCVVIGGRIHNGMHYLSGEIGHMLIAPGQTLEEMISSDALCVHALRAIESDGLAFSILQAQRSGRITLDSLIRAAENGCQDSRALLERAGEAAGIALCAGIMLVNPQDIVLNGTPVEEAAHEATDKINELISDL